MGQYPIEQSTTIGYLTSPLRRPSVLEKWNPYEIALFEGALALHGKQFHILHQHYVTTKSTKEIIEFYYIWKKTSHGRRWKTTFMEQHPSGGSGSGGEDSSGSSDSSGSGSDDSDSDHNEDVGEKKTRNRRRKNMESGGSTNGGLRDNKGSRSSSIVGMESVGEGSK